MPLGPDESLALTGMMGSGKTTVARILGVLLRRAVVSTDARVEAMARRSVARIFAEDGEHAFRTLERQVVRSLRGPLVIDLGGGAFCDPESAEHLLAMGPVVFLDVSWAEATRRLQRTEGEGDAPRSRPLAEHWPALLARRRPLYRRADFTIPIDGLTPGAVARRILGALEAGDGQRRRGLA